MSGTILDMHLHTTAGASDSGLSPEDLAVEARKRGLTGINITEHDRLWDTYKLNEYRARHSDLFVNNGMEVSTDLGHMIVVGLKAYVGGIRRAEELRRVLDELGGYMVVAWRFRQKPRGSNPPTGHRIQAQNAARPVHRRPPGLWTGCARARSQFHRPWPSRYGNPAPNR